MYRRSLRLLRMLPFLVVMGSLTACTLPWAQRTIAWVAAHGGKPELSHEAAETLARAIGAKLVARGYRPNTPEVPTVFYYPRGEPHWSGWYSLDDQRHVGCSVVVEREAITVTFAEVEWPRKSGVYHATDAQRQAMRQFATELETYLRRRVPPAFRVSISYGDEQRKESARAKLP